MQEMNGKVALYEVTTDRRKEGGREGGRGEEIIKTKGNEKKKGNWQ